MMDDSVDWRFEGRKEESLVLIREEEENPFDRLSDDLIVCHIFDKLPEAKCLLNCRLVCKRFSSLVYQASMISLIVLPEKPSLAKRIARWKNTILCTLFSRKEGIRLFREIWEGEFIYDMLLCLKKFKALKYVNIEFDILRKQRMEHIHRWRLDSQSDSLVMLFAKNLDSCVSMSTAIENLIEEVFWIIRKLYSWQTELKGFVFTDSEKEGTLIFDEKAILCMQNPTRSCREFSLRIWDEPKLELPSSGRVMEDVMLLVYKGDNTVDDFLITEKLGEGKENIYSEAATEMLKKEVKCQTLGRSEIFSFWFSK